MPAFVYILRCADGSCSVGSARGESLNKRIAEQQAGTHAGYISVRRPVTLVWAEPYERITDTVAYEHRLKGESRQEGSVIRGDWDGLHVATKRSGKQHKSHPPPSS